MSLSYSPSFATAWMTQIRIGPRLLLGTAVPVLLFIAFAVWMWTSLGAIREDVQSHLTAQVEMALVAKDMQRDVVQVQQYLTDVSATRGLDGLDDGFKRAAESRESFLTGLGRYQAYLKAHATSVDQQLTAQVKADFEAYYGAGVAMAEAYVKGGPESGNKMMDSFDKSAEALQEGMKKLVEKATGDMRQEVEGVAADADSLRKVGLGLCALVTLITLLGKVCETPFPGRWQSDCGFGFRHATANAF